MIEVKRNALKGLVSSFSLGMLMLFSTNEISIIGLVFVWVIFFLSSCVVDSWVNLLKMNKNSKDLNNSKS